MTIRFQNCPNISKIGKKHLCPCSRLKEQYIQRRRPTRRFFWTATSLSFDISSNPMVEKLPNAMYNLVDLESSDYLTCRRLKELPDITVEHTNVLADLRILDIRNTSIARIPSLYLRLNALEYVYLEGSPLCYNGWLETVPKDSNLQLL